MKTFLSKSVSVGLLLVAGYAGADAQLSSEGFCQPASTAITCRDCFWTRDTSPKVEFSLQRKESSRFFNFGEPSFTSGKSVAASKPRCLVSQLENDNFLQKPVSFLPQPATSFVETDSQSTPQPSEDAHELAKKLSNPVSSLISVPFQSSFDFGMGSGSGWRYTLNIQPVIPIALSPKWNLISRTILPIIHQHNVVGTSSQSGLGDITQSFFFSPTDKKKFVWAAGPVLLIPTATDDLLGTEKFGLGPTLLVLKQQNRWTYGMLTNHIWSVAGSDTRASVNSTFIQPFLAYNTKDAWTYGLNAEMTYDWTGNHWNIPIHFTVSKLLKVGKRPISVGGALRCWATSSEGGPETCGLRIIVTPLFPR